MNISAKEYQRRFAKSAGPKTTNDLTRSVITYLNLHGWKVWRNNTTGVFDMGRAPKEIMKMCTGAKPTAKSIITVLRSCFNKNPANERGIPDIIGFHKKTGRFIGVEVKTGKDKLSHYQERFKDTAERSNAIYITAKDIDQFFEDYNKIKEA